MDLSDFVQDLLNSKIYIEWPEVKIEPSKLDRKREKLFLDKVHRAVYGQDYCGCFRYCNPFYNRTDPHAVLSDVDTVTENDIEQVVQAEELPVEFTETRL